MSTEKFLLGLQHQDLKIPKKYMDKVQQFTTSEQPEKEGKDQDSRLFKQLVDIWWLALCIGIQEGQKTELESHEWHTIARARKALLSDPWRISHLQLIAIGESDDINILAEPGAVVAMANEYAATGLPLIIAALENDMTRIPIWEMTSFIEKRITAN